MTTIRLAEGGMGFGAGMTGHVYLGVKTTSLSDSCLIGVFGLICT